MIFSMVFPGQGSQSVGMLSDLATEFREIRATFDEASEALGLDLWQLAQEGPEAELNRTENTQPAMLAAGVAVYRAWLSQAGVKPTLLAGHSLGEYSALVAAESLQFADAIRLVALRGRLMQEAVPAGTGAMAAILGLDDGQIETLCAAVAAPEIAEPVNYNSPGQIVIAGTAGGVEQAMALAKEAGAKKVVPLAVSVPSHSSLMRPAAEKLEQVLADTPIAIPAIPVIHNVDLHISSSAAAIRERLVRQLHNPVRWTGTVEMMVEQGMDNIFEVGPGKVLSGLGKRIARQVNALALGDSAGFHKALEALNA